jgi:hypothetical protein
MSLIHLEESRRVASSCPFKQKFICGSIWQAALDSAGIASYLYYRETDKRYGLPSNFGFAGANFKHLLLKALVAGNEILKPKTPQYSPNQGVGCI